MNTYVRIIAVTICVSVFAAFAPAAQFSGASHDITDFANGSEVSTAGTYISGVNLLNDNVGGVGVDTTINGVLFKGTAPGQFFEGGGSFANSSFVYHGGDSSAGGLWSSGGAYGTLADSQIYNIDNPDVNAGDGYGVINLTPGTRYQLQVFMLDDRAGVSKTFPVQFQQVAWTGNFDQIDNTNPPIEIGYLDNVTIGGNGVTQANGEIATVSFTIASGYNGLLVNTWNNGAFNGMQLRQLPAAVLGDYDGNGTVGPEDYQIWKASFGSTTNLAADGNSDGVVDAADYVVWRGALTGPGSGSSLTTSTVPEPNTILIASMAIAILGSIFRPRRQLA
jgi:hypothetical protein